MCTHVYTCHGICEEGYCWGLGLFSYLWALGIWTQQLSLAASSFNNSLPNPLCITFWDRTRSFCQTWGLLANTELADSSALANKPQDRPVAASRALGLWPCAALLSFLYRCFWLWDRVLTMQPWLAQILGLKACAATRDSHNFFMWVWEVEV